MSDVRLVERLRAEYSRTGAYAPEATCRHGIHPYDCREGCAPPTFEAANKIEALAAELAAAIEHNQALQEIARKAIPDAVAEAKRIVQAELAELAALKREWQPIETAPKDEEAIFWIRGRQPSEQFYLEKGDEPTPVAPSRLFIGKLRRWPATMKGMYWMPLPAPPQLTPAGEAEDSALPPSAPGSAHGS